MAPAQKPGKSVQEVGTPDEFIAAVENRFGKIDVDLAGDHNLHVVGSWYGPGSQRGVDSLAVSWVGIGHGFLNPPFGNITPWVEKCAKEIATNDTRLQIGVLLPAALETNWFSDHVYNKASVLILKPRLKFKGHAHDFPKGLMYCLYSKYNVGGIKIWDWKEDVIY